jgi:hypothetical protein
MRRQVFPTAPSPTTTHFKEVSICLFWFHLELVVFIEKLNLLFMFSSLDVLIGSENKL